MKKYNLSEVAEYLDIPNVGKTKLYVILRELEIIESNNRPAQKYVDMDLLSVGTPKVPRMKKGVVQYVTLVVDQRGLRFVKKAVTEYLQENPVPKIKKNPRISYGTNI